MSDIFYGRGTHEQFDDYVDFGDIDAVVENPSGNGLIPAQNASGQSGFTTARLTNKSNGFSSVDNQVRTVDSPY